MKRIGVGLMGLLALVAVAAAAIASTGPKTPGLAFVTGGPQGNSDVWLGNATGAHAHQLASGQQPILSPNGKLVATVTSSEHGASLFVYSASGMVLGKFFDIGQDAAVPLGWSSDSRYLAVELIDDRVTQKIGSSGLEVVDTTTEKATKIASGEVWEASFAPTGDKLVFGLSKSQSLNTPLNLYRAAPDGSGLTQLTHDGRSANPVWGARGIAFDRVTFRGRSNAPAYQIFLMKGGHATQITHSHPGSLVSGLVPIAVSANGTRLLAEFGGQDTSQAYAVGLSTHTVRELKDKDQSVTGSGISADGKRILVVIGGFEAPPSAGNIATIPFSGGPPTILVKDAGEPSWNQ